MKYQYPTRKGTFSIVPETRDGRHLYVGYFEGEYLGAYVTLQVAAEQISIGSCNWPGTIDPETLDIPNDPSEWTQIE